MVSSFSFKISLEKWRHDLQDINFWLNGYLKSPAYRDLEAKLDRYIYVQWNVGVGPAACFTRAISSITREVKMRKHGPFDHVIEVDMKQPAVLGRTRLSIEEKLAIKVGEQLGLANYEYDRLAKGDELWYYTYGLEDATLSLQQSTVFQILKKLIDKKCLLVINNLNEPIKPIKINAFTEDLLFLPPPQLQGSCWLVSGTSKDVYDRSKPGYNCVVDYFSGDDILMLTLYSLHQAAKYILRMTGHKDEQYWHHVAVQCLHHVTVLLIPHCTSVHGDGDQQRYGALADITSDELIRHWAAQDLITTVEQERTCEVTPTSYQGKYNDIYQVGNIILEAFREYSLLLLPFSPATKTDEATQSVAHFLVCHGLIAESHTTDDELFEGNHPGLQRMQCISHVGDKGWHVSRDGLSQGASGPTTLIIRNCSQHLTLFRKLQSDHFLAKLSLLHVLDLSYTPLESLPPSICYLQKLQLLSLRGCYNLRNPFSFPDTETTLCQSNSSKKLKLLYLDLSYSNISTFQDDFFHNVPNLKELLLANCSSLEELPPSTAALCSLTKLELIDNKKFMSFTGLTEISLDGHGTLSSFSLVGTPHIKRLSLRGCRKLECVDIKEVDALEELDLSATAIKEITENIPNLPKLRQLLLVGVPSLRRFPWHKLQRLLDVFCLDQCSDRTGNHSNPQAAQAITRKIHDEEDMVKTNKLQVARTVYADVNRRYMTDGVSMVSMDDVPPFQETECHVEISAVDRYPHGLKYLLQVTKSMSMSDDTHVSCLSDLDYLDDSELEECKFQQCHQMVHVFSYMYVNSLKNAHVSYLKSLTHFFGYGDPNFTALKHVHLEHCPRLKGVISRDCKLPSLVTLDILFCYDLKAIFYNNGNYSSSSSDYRLPCLRRLSLQELPLLKHLHVDNPILTSPAWEELHVRGCWSLRRLPRLNQQPDKAVKVSGERAWWTKLRWDQDDDGVTSHRGSYKPRLPPVSASIRERVIIKTYLR